MLRAADKTSLRNPMDSPLISTRGLILEVYVCACVSVCVCVLGHLALPIFFWSDMIYLA